MGIGPKEEHARRQVMQILFKDKCLERFCWGGSINKASFSEKKNIINIMFKVILRPFANITRDSLKAKIKILVKQNRSKNETFSSLRTS